MFRTLILAVVLMVSSCNAYSQTESNRATPGEQIVKTARMLTVTLNLYCGPTWAMKNVTTVMGLKRYGFGINRKEDVLYQLLSNSTGAWSVLLTDKKGMTCVMAGGKNWSVIPTP